MSMRILRKHKKVPLAIKLALHVVVQGRGRNGKITVQDCHEECSSPEQELWRDFIARMALDALGVTGISKRKPEHKQAISEARDWFWHSYDDMQLAFEFAGLDFDHVVTIVRETLNVRNAVPHSRGYVSSVASNGNSC
jgi:hypothetical protein